MTARSLIASAGLLLAAAAQAQVGQAPRTRIWETGPQPVSVGDSLQLLWDAPGAGAAVYDPHVLIALRNNPYAQDGSTDPMDVHVRLKVTAATNPQYQDYHAGNDGDTLLYVDLHAGVRGQRLLVAGLNDQLAGQDGARLLNGVHGVLLELDQVQVNAGGGWAAATRLPRGVLIEVNLAWARAQQPDLQPLTGLGAQLYSCSGTQDAQEIVFRWDVHPGAVAYDLEWTWVDDYGHDPSSDVIGVRAATEIRYDLRRDATRVSVRGDRNSYRTPLLYPRGWVIWRVRAVVPSGADPAVLVPGAWPPAVPPEGPVSGAQSGSGCCAHPVPGHQRDKNWQATSSFAEESLHKEVVTYADGTSRKRQVVTRSNTLGVPIVGETVYDVLGRPAVEVLPVPVVKKECIDIADEAWGPIEFVPRFNQVDVEGLAEPFTPDHLLGEACGPGGPELSPNSGAAYYYSQGYAEEAGPLLVPPPPFLPRSGGRPYSQAEYTRDNTGRVRAQGGVGPAFKLGGEGSVRHDTRYFYGKPEQVQLDRLFGSEAGYAHHYGKQVTTDPNGQVGVTYTDMAGRTVATALACAPPEELLSLYPPGQEPGTQELQTDLFNGLAGTDPSIQVLAEGPALVFTTSLAVPCASDHVFDYTLVAKALNQDCWAICAHCVYDLDITLEDALCHEVIFSHTATAGSLNDDDGLVFLTSCTARQAEANTFTWPHPPTGDEGPIVLTLQPGEYTLRKTLRVHAPARDHYVDLLKEPENNGCVLTRDDMEADLRGELSASGCDINCQTCYTSLGTLESFVALGHTEDEYYYLLAQCDDLCKPLSWCDVALRNMLGDVSRWGQYGKLTKPDQQWQAPDRTSVFHPAAGSVLLDLLLNSGSSDDPWRSAVAGVPIWRQPLREKYDGQWEAAYIDNTGDRLMIPVIRDANDDLWPAVLDEEALFAHDGMLYTWPENLAELHDFILYWQPGWEQSLVRFHPEYCYYRDCRSYGEPVDPEVRLSSSDGYDGRLRAAATCQQAVADGLLQEVSGNYVLTAATGDPFVTSGWNTGPANDLVARIGQFAQGHSMTAVAVSLELCTGNPTGAGCADFDVNLPTEVKDRIWVTLKSFYLSEKYRVQKRKADAAVRDCGCAGLNACIGEEHPANWWGELGTPLSFWQYWSPWGNWEDHWAAYLAAWAAQPRNMRCQPCSQWTYHWFDDKARRFPEPDRFPGFTTRPMDAAYQHYQLTGQCPGTAAYQGLFHGLLTTGNWQAGWQAVHLAVNNYDPSTPIPEADLSVATLYNTKTITVEYQDGVTPDCVIGLTIPYPPFGWAWENITQVARMTITGATTFTLEVVVEGHPDPVLINGTGLCHDLRVCNFPIQCTPNERVLQFVDLLNMLAPQPGLLSGTGVDLAQEAPPGGGTTEFPDIQSALGPVLRAQFSPDAQLEWTWTGTALRLEDVDPSHSAWMEFNNLQTDLGSVGPLLAQAAYFTNLRLRYEMPTPPHGFQRLVMDAWDGTGNLLGELSGTLYDNGMYIQDISMGTCGYPPALECRGPQFTLARELGVALSGVATVIHGVRNPLDSVNVFDPQIGIPAHVAHVLCPACDDQWMLDGEPALYAVWELNEEDGTYTITLGECLTVTYELSELYSPVGTRSGDMVFVGEPDANGAYHEFEVPLFNALGVPAGMLYGHAPCVDLYPCDPCPEEPWGRLQEVGNTAYQWDVAPPPCDPMELFGELPGISAPEESECRCCDAMENAIVVATDVRYRQYVDSLTSAIRAYYDSACMQALETFAMRFTDNEYHYTLYYYDQAGNLVRTVPPAGVYPLDCGVVDPVTHVADGAITAALAADRLNGTRTVFTDHAMASDHVYNSLGQPVRSAMPDQDTMELASFTVPAGLPAHLSITGSSFLQGGRGYLTGYYEHAGKDRGLFYSTDDGGLSWREERGLVGADLRGIHMVPGIVDGVAVGDHGTVLETSDAGTSWDLHTGALLTDRVQWRDVVAKDADHFVAVGASNGSGRWGYRSGAGTYGLLPPLPVHALHGVGYNGSAYVACGEVALDGPGVWYNAATPSSSPVPTGGGNTTADLLCGSIVPGGAPALAGQRGVLVQSMATAARTVRTGTTDNVLGLAFRTQETGVAIMDSSGVGVLRGRWAGSAGDWLPIGTPDLDLRALASWDNPMVAHTEAVAVGKDGQVVRAVIQSGLPGVIRVQGPAGGPQLVGVWARPQGGALRCVAVDAGGTVHFTADLRALPPVWETCVPTWAGQPLEVEEVAGYAFTQGVHVLARIQDGTDMKRTTLLWDLTKPLGHADRFTVTSGPADSGVLTVAATDAGRGLVLTNGAVHAVALTDPLAPTTANVAAPPAGRVRAAIPVGEEELYLAGDGGFIAVGKATMPDGQYNVWEDRSETLQPLALFAIDEGGQVAVGAQGTLHVRDGGIWHAVPTALVQDLRAVAVNAAGMAVAVGDGGAVVALDLADYADPDAQTIHNLPQATDLHAVAIAGGQVVIGGQAGNLWRTPDISLSTPLFTRLPWNAGNIYGVTVQQGLGLGPRMFAVGAHALMHSLLGATRMPVADLYPPRLNAVYFSDGGKGYVVGDKLTVRRTTDAGRHWEVEPVPGPVFDLLAVQGNGVHPPLAAGTQGKVLTLLPGTGYTAATHSGETYTTVAITASGAVVLGGRTATGNNGLYRTRPAPGGTWSAAVTLSNRPLYASWSFPPWMEASGDFGEDVLLAGEDGYLRLLRQAVGSSSSPAVVWSHSYPAVGNILGLYFHDRQTGFALTSIGGLRRFSAPSLAHDVAFTAPGAPLPMADALPDHSMYPGTIGFSSRTRGFTGGRQVGVGGAVRRLASTIEDEGGLYSQRFWYDALGRIVLSQNAKQLGLVPVRYSYSLYDDLGRVEEAGEVEDDTQQEESLRMVVPGMDVGGVFKPDVLDPEVLKAWVLAHPRREVTRTFYDAPGPGSPFGPHPTYRLRVATTAYYEAEYAGPTPDEQAYDHATHYRYDIHGNVKELVQDHPRMAMDGGAAEQGHKRLEYRYDLVSGNVREVAYQRGWNDALHHRYGYDADSRLTRVEASADGVDWTDQANYFYYPHGPLERMELGHHRVQGVDYAYTLQGWLKGVNSELLLPGNDQGQDGLAGTANALVGRDAFGFSLGYYGDADYQPISAARWATVGDRPFAPVGTAGTLAGAYHPLYNGNIAHGSLGLQPFGGWTGTGQQGQVLGKVYAYDQLNRLRTALGVAGSGNTWQDVVDGTADRYRSAYTYDANGNIRTADRYDGDGAQYDAFSYKYQAPSGRLLRNRLYELFDAADEANALVNAGLDEQAEDIKYRTGPFDPANPAINTAYNYEYDALGNLVRDTREGITGIDWTVAGKVRSVAKATGPSLQFGYGAGGQRILKQVGTPEVDGTGMREHYVHDAQGNVMAIYRYTNGADGMSFKVAERPLYGSTRLGLLAQEEELYGEAAAPAPFARPLQPPGLRYELTDHLGTVKTVVSGRLLHGAGAGSAKQAEVLLADDHEPFGALLPGRNYRQPVGGPPPPPVTPKGTLIITEFSNGPSGDCEYVELYVTKCSLYPDATEVDIRGWILDDNGGNFNTEGGCTTGVGISSGHLRFAAVATWASVPVGSVIVLYNGNDNCYAFTAQEAGTGGQYFVNVNSTTLIERTGTGGTPSSSDCGYCGNSYTATSSSPSSWSTIAMGNSGDAIQVRCPDCPDNEAGFFHGLGYGSGFNGITAGTNDLGGAYVSGPGGGRTYELTGPGAPGNGTNWTRISAPNGGTPPATAGVVDASVVAWLEGASLACCGSFEAPVLAQKQGYRFGFNGKEKDNEIYSATGTSYDYGARMYDPRVGRWLSLDPMAGKYPFISPYNIALNTPIQAKDPDGNLVIFVNGYNGKKAAIRDINDPIGTGRAIKRFFSKERLSRTDDNAYWGGMDYKFMGRIEDYNAMYADGSSHALSTAAYRYERGKEAGNVLLEQISAGEVEMKAGETIKIVSHSQGGSYAAGMSQVLSDAGYKIEVEYYIAPKQPKDIPETNAERRVQYGSVKDWVAPQDPMRGDIEQGGSPGKDGHIDGHMLENYQNVFDIDKGRPGYVAPRNDVKENGGGVLNFILLILMFIGGCRNKNNGRICIDEIIQRNENYWEYDSLRMNIMDSINRWSDMRLNYAIEYADSLSEWNIDGILFNENQSRLFGWILVIDKTYSANSSGKNIDNKLDYVRYFAGEKREGKWHYYIHNMPSMWFSRQDNGGRPYSYEYLSGMAKQKIIDGGILNRCECSLNYQYINEWVDGPGRDMYRWHRKFLKATSARTPE